MMMRGAARPGTEAVLTTASLAAMRASSTSCCLRLLLGGELARVAAGALGARRRSRRTWRRATSPARGRAAHVVGLDHGAQAPAVAMACSPATPAPMMSTCAGRMVPAAVVSIGRNFCSAFAAISTAL